MGSAQGHLSPNEQRAIVRSANFSHKDLKRIHKRFMALDTNQNGQLDPHELFDVPEIADNPLVKRVISVFDTDGDGKVSFVEFLVGLAKLTAGTDEQQKIKFAFDIYDTKKDGYISNGELFCVMKMMVGNNLNDKQLQQLVDRTMLQADKDYDGLISFQEFQSVVAHVDIAEKLKIDGTTHTRQEYGEQTIQTIRSGSKSFHDYNGGSILAMVGKNCYAIASDKRLGSNQFHTVETNVEKVFPVTNKTMLAAVGLATDVQTIGNTIRFHKNLFHLREEREMKPNAVAHFVANMLYKRRFSPWYLSTIVAGLDADNKASVWDYDVLGAIEVKACGYAAAGTAQDQILGMAEYLWRENLAAEELFEICSQCLTAGIDRDCLSGWGAVIHVVTPTEVITRHIKTRMD